jgi:hypothetical protein
MLVWRSFLSLSAAAAAELLVRQRRDVERHALTRGQALLPAFLIQVTEALMRWPHFVEALGQFISSYHEKPAPDEVPQWLEILLADDTLNQLNPHQFELVAHSFGHIGRGNVKLVRLYEASFDNARLRGKVLVIRILRVCGDADTVAAITKWESTTEWEEPTNELASARQFLEDPKRTLPRDRPAQVLEDLDLLWADFLTTGEYAPVSRILDVLDGPDQFRMVITRCLNKNRSKKEKEALFAKLEELKLLEPGSKDKLLSGNLDLKLDSTTLPDAIDLARTVLGKTVEKLIAGIVLKAAASGSMQSNLQQYPRLVKLVKAKQKKRPHESQAVIKKWLTTE